MNQDKSNIEDPDTLFYIFEDHFWYNKEDIIKDITEKLKEFGYSTEDITKDNRENEYFINFLCKHGVIFGHIWIYEDEDEGYLFDISDYDIDGILHECPKCEKVRLYSFSV